jgi:hypothetical protein
MSHWSQAQNESNRRTIHQSPITSHLPLTARSSLVATGLIQSLDRGLFAFQLGGVGGHKRVRVGLVYLARSSKGPVSVGLDINDGLEV